MNKLVFNKFHIKLGLIGFALSTSFWIGCTSSSSDPATGASGLSISGVISTGTVTSTSVIAHPVYVDKRGVAVSQKLGQLSEGVSAKDVSALDVSTYTIRCVTLSGTLASGEGSVASTGAFSLSLAAETGAPIGCFVLSGTTLIASMAFEGSTTGMSGGATREGTYVAGNSAGGLDFGAITVDVDKGLAVVKKTNIVATGGAGSTTGSGAFVDMTGVWTIAAVANPPTGYSTAGTEQDKGPTVGMQLYLGQYTANDGTANHYGLSIWESQSAYTTCTSGGGEGAQLPSGWTGPTALTGAMAGINTSFPSPTSATISSVSHGGQTLCNATISGSETCNDFGGSVTWSSPSQDSSHWGMSPEKCKFYCAMNSAYDSDSGCASEFRVNWGSLWSHNSGNPFGGISWSGSAWTGLTADTSDSSQVTYLGGNVVFKKEPRKRFMMNEIVINGNVGTLLDHKNWEQQACTTNSSGGCESGTQVQCKISENNRLTITQVSATSATVELVQTRKVSPTDPAICSTDTNVSRDLGDSKYMFTLNK